MRPDEGVDARLDHLAHERLERARAHQVVVLDRRGAGEVERLLHERPHAVELASERGEARVVKVLEHKVDGGERGLDLVHPRLHELAVLALAQPRVGDAGVRLGRHGLQRLEGGLGLGGVGLLHRQGQFGGVAARPRNVGEPPAPRTRMQVVGDAHGEQGERHAQHDEGHELAAQAHQAQHRPEQPHGEQRNRHRKHMAAQIRPDAHAARLPREVRPKPSERQASPAPGQAGLCRPAVAAMRGAPCRMIVKEACTAKF